MMHPSKDPRAIPRIAPAERRPGRPRARTSGSTGPAIVLRLFLLAGAGAASALLYTAIAMALLGQDLGATGAIVAAMVGGAIGGLCGLILGRR